HNSAFSGESISLTPFSETFKFIPWLSLEVFLFCSVLACVEETNFFSLLNYTVFVVLLFLYTLNQVCMLLLAILMRVSF
ncbi:MAG: hypothetical protein ACP5KW_02110, partial [Thermoproteota archaeon]